jgi:membrane AbrB-like protein
VLIGLTVLLILGMRLAHVPAALMLGPMVAGMVIATYRPGPQLPRGATVVAQAVLGCLIAHAMSPHLLVALAPRWPILLGMNLLVVLGILGLGIIATRMQFLPGTAGIWGMSPGGAAAMVMLSEAYGSDKRVVAVMQYLRLVCAVLAVILVGSMLGTPHVGPPTMMLPGPGTDWLPHVDIRAFATTIVLATAGVALALLLRKPTLVIFVPIFTGIALQSAGWVAPEVPPLLSAAAFGAIGWHIGLSFTRASLLHCARLLPRILAGIAAILLLCAALSVLFSRLAHVDFVTAYLAINPGGADVVMVMAASVAVDLPLVMAMQISRLLLVIALAPILGRLAANHYLKAKAAGEGPSDDAARELARDVDTIA